MAATDRIADLAAHNLLRHQQHPLKPEAADGMHLFARFAFDLDVADAVEQGRFAVPLSSLGGAALEEYWYYPGPVEWTQVDGLSSARCADYWLLSLAVIVADGSMLSATRDAYAQLLGMLAGSDFPHIVKAWNYIPDINRGSDDDERYKRFVLGRGEAFDQAGRNGSPPAATAVGSPAGSPLVIHLLAGRQAVRPLENPRQLSAFHYPRQHGPRSPAFSRAACLGSGEGLQVMVSGTAAIVGHQSQHDFDAQAQAQETRRNLRALLKRAAGDRALSNGSLRLYLRAAEQWPALRQSLAGLTQPPFELLPLQADICRRELVVEIDGLIDAT